MLQEVQAACEGRHALLEGRIAQLDPPELLLARILQAKEGLCFNLLCFDVLPINAEACHLRPKLLPR